MADDINSVIEHGLSDHTGSIQTLELAARWLNECIQKHNRCAAAREAPSYPTRLLFLGDEDESGNSQMKLHCPEDLEPGHPYATLSHCWGTTKPLQLLTCNLDALRKDIPLRSLPKTFQDAVRIARHLDLTYIWIDSLCIVQDSREDWEREAARMEAVYRNSACNIAAADASNGTEGCLYPRNPRWIVPVKIPVRGTSRRSPKYLANQTNLFSSHTLYSRGWVLQELLLAPRTLNCGKAQLFWDCQELHASEILLEGRSDSSWSNGHPASRFLRYSSKTGEHVLSASLIEETLTASFLAGHSFAVPTIHANEAFSHWASVVGAYTAMNLTKPDDKFVALSGIVSIFRRYLGEYLAGLWRIWLPCELLWCTSEPASRPDTYRAPSWSWASTNSRVTYAFCSMSARYAFLADVIDVCVTYDNHHKSSLVTGAELRLKGKLARASWSRIPGREYRHNLMNSHDLSDSPESSPGRCAIVYFDEHVEDQDRSPDIWSLPIGCRRRGDTATYGLVLDKVDERTFRRVGIFRDSNGCLASRFERLPRTVVTII
ncbi:hypothetical protein W97_02805 [Coniosporium apollinis CBS 100218]|uniref:Heterokaryon incompatibility domain-containing protein n=1 Tax=Coniosporium apollinis (strain CBS 100218) TaxID=1168221 RepID=R7YNV9_CONA1|nr:uncharacterized protein W97_02805 [Coniosporium apollinis CBS 100218]EON63577.1 hypothetical protein W97_02805 [Coniosporium apollinis CBS 100218]